MITLLNDHNPVISTSHDTDVSKHRWSPRGRPWPWPRNLKSSKIALPSARGQHYFLYR